MDIQLINESGKNEKGIVVSYCTKLSAPRSFEDYDLNIIDLSSKDIWKNYSNSRNTTLIDSIKDFDTLGQFISRTNKAKILIVIPKNLSFKTGYDFYGEKFNSTIMIKDMISVFNNILRVIYGEPYNLLYEPTSTKINNDQIGADFIFEENNYLGTTLRSNKSNRIVSVVNKNLHITTLDIENQEQLQAYLETVGFYSILKEIPEWLEEINYLDDIEYKHLINESEEKIKKLNLDIEKARLRLDNNNHFKSILYASGDDLVDVVKEILETILGLDLSTFEDKFNEDLRFEYNGDIYIVEIKGNNKGIRLDNVTQLHNHAVTFVEDNKELEDEKIEYGEVYSLLIRTPQREKPMNERNEIDEDVIKDAENIYNVLIIRTRDLLKAYENFLNGTMSQEDFVNLIQKTGIFKL